MRLHYCLCFYLFCLVYYEFKASASDVEFSYKGLTMQDMTPWVQTVYRVPFLINKPKLIVTSVSDQDRVDFLRVLSRNSDISFTSLKDWTLEWSSWRVSSTWSASISVDVFNQKAINVDNSNGPGTIASNIGWKTFKPTQYFSKEKDFNKGWSDTISSLAKEKNLNHLKRIKVSIKGPEQPLFHVLSFPSQAARADTLESVDKYGKLFGFTGFDGLVHLDSMQNQLGPKFQNRFIANLANHQHSCLVITHPQGCSDYRNIVNKFINNNNDYGVHFTSNSPDNNMFQEVKYFVNIPEFKNPQLNSPERFGWQRLEELIGQLWIKVSIDALPFQVATLEELFSNMGKNDARSELTSELTSAIANINTLILETTADSWKVDSKHGIKGIKVKPFFQDLANKLKATIPVYQMLVSCANTIANSPVATVSDYYSSLDMDDDEADQDDITLKKKKSSLFKGIGSLLNKISKPKKISEETEDGDEEDGSFQYCDIKILKQYENYKQQLEDIMQKSVEKHSLSQDLMTAFGSIVLKVTSAWQGLVHSAMDEFLQQVDLLLNHILLEHATMSTPNPGKGKSTQLLVNNILQEMIERTKKVAKDELYDEIDYLLELETNSHVLDKDMGYYFYEEAYAASVLNYLERDVKLAFEVYEGTLQKSSKFNKEDVTSISHLLPVIRQLCSSTEGMQASPDSMFLKYSKNDRQKSIVAKSYSSTRSSSSISRHVSQSRSSACTMYTRVTKSTELLVSTSSFLHIVSSRFADNLYAMIHNGILQRLASTFMLQRFNDQLCENEEDNEASTCSKAIHFLYVANLKEPIAQGKEILKKLKAA